MEMWNNKNFFSFAGENVEKSPAALWGSLEVSFKAKQSLVSLSSKHIARCNSKNYIYEKICVKNYIIKFTYKYI